MAKVRQPSLCIRVPSYSDHDEELSIERVAALAQVDQLPTPSLDIMSLTSSNSGFNQYRTGSDIRAPVPTRAYTTDDPWSNPKVPAIPSATTNGANGTPSNIAGTGLPGNWWRKLETINVNILGQQGFILNRYLVYEIATDVSTILTKSTDRPQCTSTLLQRAPPVPRRYSEFLILWDCLVRRYPFRLLPALPPKRIGRK